MDFIEKIMNNQFLFYSILALISIGIIIVITLVYMKRRNLKLFEQEEKRLLEEIEKPKRKKVEEEIKIQKIEDPEELKITKIETEEVAPKANLEEVLEKMQADLDKKEDIVTLFEQEQEEKAIISYQELLNSKNQNNKGANKELLSVIEQIENGKQEKGMLQPDYTEEEMNQVENKNKKFKNTEFISPVYGKIENHTKYPTIPSFKKGDKKTRSSRNNVEVNTELENNELEDEEVRNDAFLNALKKFRNNL